jgi:hypothetical protein
MNKFITNKLHLSMDKCSWLVIKLFVYTSCTQDVNTHYFHSIYKELICMVK